MLSDRIQSSKPVITPSELLQLFPASEKSLETVKRARHIAREIIHGHDPRLLVVVGPCSIHDSQAALEYAYHLKQAAEKFSDDLFLIMRVYLEKPRTLTGWKGLISDPQLNGSYQISEGLKLARQLLLQLNEINVPAGTEFLDTLVPHYLSDLISWAAIGARTSESQIHRELASGLSMPVGFKNNTDGNIKVAIDAIHTARHPHYFLSITPSGVPSVINTTGNPDSHIILRGANTHSNYGTESIKKAIEMLYKADLTPRLMIDCSHGNSMKNYLQQITVANSIANEIQSGSQSIFGIMLESNLVAGKQALVFNQPLTYGQSITDACLCWNDTLLLLQNLALAKQSAKKIK